MTVQREVIVHTLFVTFPAAGAQPGTLGWVARLADRASGGCLPMGNAPSSDAAVIRRWQAAAVDEIRAAAAELELRRVVLVGHSMGGLSAMSLRGAVEAALDVPVTVVTLNTPAPDGDGRIPTLSASSDEEIAALLDGGTGEAVAGHPAVLAELADDIRADADVADALAAVVHTLGRVGDLVAVTARGDRFIGRDRCAAWRQRVSGGFRLEQVEGNHMLLDTPPDILAGVLRSALTPQRT